MLGSWEISWNEQVPYKACLRKTLSEMITPVLQATPFRDTEMQCSLKYFNFSGSSQKVFLSENTFPLKYYTKTFTNSLVSAHMNHIQ
jgi:hypothetical protein